jgi:hypothetical protein
VGRNHAEEGEGKGMRKTQNFRKVEELIELRKQFRSVAGVAESIGESIRLWQKYEKIHEYWEYGWRNQSRQIDICLATVQADLRVISDMTKRFGSLPWCADLFNRDQVSEYRDNYTRQTLASGRPVIHKLIGLRRIAQETTPEIQKRLDWFWERWIRKDYRAEASSVHQIVLTLVSLEIEIQENWAFIAGLPERADNLPEVAIR